MIYLRAALFGAVVLLAAMPVSAPHAETTWEVFLQAQILKQEQCDIEFVLNVREMEVGGVPTVSGRVHCRDGRSFDFSRLHPDEEFELKNCQPLVC